MKITLSFTDTPNISSLPRGDIFNSHFKLPDEAQRLPDCRERILAIATLVGKLTWACLHVTCYEVGLKEYPVKTDKAEGGTVFTAANHPLALRIDQKRPAKFPLNRTPPHVDFKIVGGVRIEEFPRSEEQKDLAVICKQIGEHCVYLLNTNPDPDIRWEYGGRYTRYYDGRAIKRFRKRQKK